MKRFDVGAPARRCCKTGRELKPGEIYYAALVRTENGLERFDYAPEAWQGPPEGAIGFWRGRVPAPRHARFRILDDETAMEGFLSLEADQRPRARTLRYILALHLMRRRLLRLVRIETRGDEDYIRVRSTRERKAEWLVWCPALTEEEIRDLEANLAEMLADFTKERRFAESFTEQDATA